MDEQRLISAVKSFKSKQNTPKFEELLQERNNRIKYYQSFTADKIKEMSVDDLYEYISNLWSMIIWGNKKYIVDKIVRDNDFDNLKQHLIDLIYGKERVEKRWDKFLSEIKGLGPSTVSELLCYTNPDDYFILNKTTTRCFEYLSKLSTSLNLSRKVYFKKLTVTKN